MKMRKHRVRTKLWRLEVMIGALKHILDEGEATTSELKCYVHVPPDVINRAFTRRLDNTSVEGKTRNGAESDVLACIMRFLVSRGFLQKEKNGRINIYRSTDLTRQALEAYKDVLNYNESNNGEAKQ